MSRKPRSPVSKPSRSSVPGRDRKASPRAESAAPSAAPRAKAKRPAAASAAAGGKGRAAPRFVAHEPQRIAKLLARAGVGSRRDVERMIAEGRIALNGEVLTTPAVVLASLEGVTVDGAPVKEVEPTRLWRFYKPAGCLTTVRDPEGRPTIYDMLPKGMPRVVTIGRLDFNTEGLLLLTNNGELKRWLELPANAVERIYRARVRGRLNHAALADLIEGVTIDGVHYGPINAEVETSRGLTHWVAVKIREGKNREVRNVLGHLGLQVSRLIRTDYGPYTVDGLREGEVQEVSPFDIPGVPRELLPPRDFGIEDVMPRRREELFAPASRREAAPASDDATTAPARAKPRDGQDRPRRQTKTAEARQKASGSGPNPAAPSRKDAPAAEAGAPPRKKLERKPGWAKPKVAAKPKPRRNTKPRGRKP